MNVFVHPTAEVSESAKIGSGTRIWNQAQIREEVVIGENCVLGKDVYIDKGVKIGNRVKIENGVSIFQGVTIEDNVLIGANAAFTNDKYPRAFKEDWQIVPTIVRHGASIGANATIVCGITIGQYAMVGAGSVVSRDVFDYGLVYGNPARLHGFVCQCGHPAEELKKEEKYVTLACPLCGEEIQIPAASYEMAKR